VTSVIEPIVVETIVGKVDVKGITDPLTIGTVTCAVDIGRVDGSVQVAGITSAINVYDIHEPIDVRAVGSITNPVDVDNVRTVEMARVVGDVAVYTHAGGVVDVKVKASTPIQAEITAIPAVVVERVNQDVFVDSIRYPTKVYAESPLPVGIDESVPLIVNTILTPTSVYAESPLHVDIDNSVPIHVDIDESVPIHVDIPSPMHVEVDKSVPLRVAVTNEKINVGIDSSIELGVYCIPPDAEEPAHGRHIS
jgi:hypothetical protein